MNDKAWSKETIKPHHALLAELETELAKGGFLTDLTRISPIDFRDIQFRNE
jgi:hypothetical protein